MHFKTIVKTYGNGPPPDPPPPPNIWKFPYVSLFFFLKASLKYFYLKIMRGLKLVVNRYYSYKTIFWLLTKSINVTKVECKWSEVRGSWFPFIGKMSSLLANNWKFSQEFQLNISCSRSLLRKQEVSSMPESEPSPNVWGLTDWDLVSTARAREQLPFFTTDDLLWCLRSHHNYNCTSPSFMQ